MNVRWYEQALADVNPDSDWLCATEKSRLDGLRIPKRRSDWRLGRWTAKRAVADHLKLTLDRKTLAAIEIRPAASGAPEAFIDGTLAPLSISLSHCEGVAACAVAEAGSSLGCDVEVVEPRSDAFVADYFTTEEQQITRQASARDQSAVIALIWSAKESALKVLRTGLRSDTRCVSVAFGDDRVTAVHRDDVTILCSSCRTFAPEPITWRRLHIRHATEIFQGWWYLDSPLVRTLVVSDLGLRPQPGTTEGVYRNCSILDID